MTYLASDWNVNVKVTWSHVSLFSVQTLAMTEHTHTHTTLTSHHWPGQNTLNTYTAFRSKFRSRDDLNILWENNYPPLTMTLKTGISVSLTAHVCDRCVSVNRVTVTVSSTDKKWHFCNLQTRVLARQNTCIYTLEWTRCGMAWGTFLSLNSTYINMAIYMYRLLILYIIYRTTHTYT